MGVEYGGTGAGGGAGGGGASASTVPFDATTFEEPTWAVSLTGPQVSQGRLKLPDSATGTTATINTDGGGTASTARRGWQINPNTGLAGVRLSFNYTNGTAVPISLETTGGTVLDQTAAMTWDATTTVDLMANLEAGTTYNIIAGDGVTSFTHRPESAGAWPETSTDLDGVGTYNNGTTGTGTGGFNFNAAQALFETGNGTATLVPPATGGEVESYQQAWAKVDPAGETATVDLQYADGTVVEAGLTGAVDISAADATRDLRFAVTLSRASMANNPVVKAVGFSATR